MEKKFRFFFVIEFKMIWLVITINELSSLSVKFNIYWSIIFNELYICLIKFNAIKFNIYQIISFNSFNLITWFFLKNH